MRSSIGTPTPSGVRRWCRLSIPQVVGVWTLLVKGRLTLTSAPVRTRSDTTPVNSDPVLTWYASPSFSFPLVFVPTLYAPPVVPPSDYAPLVGTPVPFRMFSLVSVVLRNSRLSPVVVYLRPAPDSSGVLAAYAIFVTSLPSLGYHLSVTDLPSMPWVLPLAYTSPLLG